MEEVLVSALSSFNSKQWQMQQHDLLLTQQREQLEQLKKEQEELKTRLRRYGKVSMQSAQVSPKHVTVIQAAPHQPVTALTTADTGNDSVKQSNEVLDNSKSDMKNTTPVLGDDSSSTTVTRDTNSSNKPEDNDSALRVTCSTNGGPLNYDERPIKPLQG